MMKSLFITFSKHDLLASTTCRYINKIAIEGYGRSKDVAEFYDSSRPSYSLETINKVSDIINSNNNDNDVLNVLEVATGTGKFTKSFMKNESVNTKNQNKYIVTEPIETFISQLNVKDLESNKWKIDKHITSSDKLKMISDKSVHAIIAAQSFHWMDNITTLKEFHRVLLPNKPIIFVWNSFDVDIDYIRQIEDIIDERYKLLESLNGVPVPRYRSLLWETVFDTIEANFYFEPIKKWSSLQIYKFTHFYCFQKLKEFISFHLKILNILRKFLIAFPIWFKILLIVCNDCLVCEYCGYE